MIHHGGATVPNEGEHRSRHVGELDAAIEARRGISARPISARSPEQMAALRERRGKPREVWTADERAAVRAWWQAKEGRFKALCAVLGVARSSVQAWFGASGRVDTTPSGLRARVRAAMEAIS